MMHAYAKLYVWTYVYAYLAQPHTQIHIGHTEMHIQIYSYPQKIYSYP